MDGLYTRCPHCQTVFRLSEQHLAAANGRVRCGACFQVFDAVNHRVRPVQKRSPELNRPAPAAGLSGASAPTGTQTGTSPAGAHLASVTSGLTAADERPAGNVHALRPASAATDAAAAVAAPNDDPTGQPQAAGTDAVVPGVVVPGVVVPGVVVPGAVAPGAATGLFSAGSDIAGSDIAGSETAGSDLTGSGGASHAADGHDTAGYSGDPSDRDTTHNQPAETAGLAAADSHWTLTVDDIFAPLQGGLGAGTPDPLSPPPPPPASVLDTFDDLGVDLDALPVPDAEIQPKAQADSATSASSPAPDLFAIAGAGDDDACIDHVNADSESVETAVAPGPGATSETTGQPDHAASWPQAEDSVPQSGDDHASDSPADQIDTGAVHDNGAATDSRATPETAVVSESASATETSAAPEKVLTSASTPDGSEPPASQGPVHQNLASQAPASPAATPVTPASRFWQAGAPVLWQLPRSTGWHIASGWSLFAEPARPRPAAAADPAPAVAPAPQDRAAETLATAASDDLAAADDASAERFAASGENDGRAERDAAAPEPGIDHHTGVMADGPGDEDFTESLTATLPETRSEFPSASLTGAAADDAFMASDFSADPLADLDRQLEREIADSLATSQEADNVAESAGSKTGFDPDAGLPTEPAFDAEPDRPEPDLPELALHEGDTIEAGAIESGTIESSAIESGVVAPDVTEPELIGFGSIESYSFEPEAVEPGANEPEPVESAAFTSDRFDSGRFTSVALDADAQAAAPEQTGEPGDDIFDRADFSAGRHEDLSSSRSEPLSEPLSEHHYPAIQDLDGGAAEPDAPASDDAGLLAAEAGIAAAALPDTPALDDGAGAGRADDGEPHSFGDLHDHIDHAIHPVAGDAHVHPASVVMATARPVSGLQAPEPDWRLEALDRPQPDAADFVAPRRFPWRGLLLTLLALLLLAVLVLQLLWPRRAALRDDPDFAPWVEWLCAHVECALPPRRDVSRIGLLQRSVLKDASAGDQLNVELLIVNQADFAQPFPDIELRFSDIDGKVVAQRRFKPGEYLRASDAPAQMPVNVPVRISFAVVEPAVPATGFEFAFLPATP